ncbi:hypothetical protein BG015_006921 [Linnemannia schmuckeri]|uniref:RING-type domain-containing protein n=1 Tax=Linnemannia schmuckeri TaxID=64567 RepID=A0A9P5S6X4_9FUNG|nr:hypothetical protein BG015_006921 [Linnemannia schmuckeri]
MRRLGPSIGAEPEAKAAMPTLSPPLLSQDTRFLLSPMPSSMVQGQNLGQGLSKTTASSSSSTVTLYPLESVPSHLLCAICTLPYENPVHFLPCCHVFCLECIQLWIVMNLGDDLLQNELRRAYPAEDDRQWIFDEMEGQGGQHPHLQQQFMVELARMGHSRSRSGAGASGNNFYDSFNHFSPAQQQLLQQQQIQQRIALLLESREMPKCPMCRTSLHIHGWDRIEEFVKVPTSTRPRPISQSDETTTTTLSFSDWMRGGSQGQGERPVSGVERRRRHDRFTANRGPRGGSRGGNREDAIGEEEDEEIEMEHVRTSRSRLNHSSSGHAMSPFPSSSSGSSFAARHQHRLEAWQQDTSDMNDDEEIQSPTTAVIGRRPSEWMRYQQRQLQAHQEREQANRQRAAAAAAAEESGDVPHPHTITASRLNEQQEQIRRLYLEQESQEELLRTLTARAASIIAAEEESRRQATNSNTTISASDSSSQHGSLLTRHEQQQEPARADRQSTSLEQPGDRQEHAAREGQEPEQDSQRVLARQSSLQIDTSVIRPSSGQSQTSQNASSTRSRQISYDNESRPEQVANPSSLQQNEDDQGPQDSTSRHQGPFHTAEEEQPLESNVDNSIINAMQQGTLAWAERPTSLQLDLGRQDEPLVLSIGDDDEGDMSASDSVSDSTMSSASSDIQLSPSNESTLSYGTTSTFSHSILNQTSVGTPFSQRSSTHPNWEQNSLSLQMPTIETEDSSIEASQQRTLDSLDEDGRGEFDEQPWNDHQRDGEEEESHVSYRKERDGLGCGELSGSTLDLEMSRAESKSRAEDFVDDIVEGEARPSSSSSQTTANTKLLNNVGQDTRAKGPTVDTQETSSQPDTVQDWGSTGASSGYGFQFSQSVWTSRSSGASPLVRELDIHCPIVTAEGSVTTIANMQIDADILARARSNSVLLSDDDLPTVRDRPSPIDSPIPTPSTARPRQRFPAGFPLLDGEGQPEEEGEEEEEEIVVAMVEEEEREVTLLESEAAPEEHPTLAAHADSIISPAEPEIVEAQAESASAPHLTTSETVVVADEGQAGSAVTAITIPISIQGTAVSESIQDPLSAAIVDNSTPLSLLEDVSSAVIESAVDRADQGQPITTPSIGPLRESLNSPPPLPLPLAAAATTVIQDQEVVASGPSIRDISTLERDTTQDEESSLRIRVSRVTNIPSSENQGPLSAAASERVAAEPRSSRIEEVEPEPETEPAEQFRTVVRYQPRLPKAHVMSDLISQIRVECPNKQFGCVETMEMQKTLQHGRDQCQFRMVMCPRARCGLWMRADQILEHILMVEPSNNLASSSSSSLSTPPSSDGPSSARSASSNSGRAHKNGITRSKTKFGSSQSSQIVTDSASASASTVTATTPNPNPLISPCPGLTWEREQLTRATGIIGHLTEENSSLRQMIRQLTLQNTKLTKEKDRLQRYANLGLGRN